MRFVIAMMKHETNTFSPVPTPFESFGNRGAYFGKEAYDLKAQKHRWAPLLI
jgi:microcystin degradation protein MlrC